MIKKLKNKFWGFGFFYFSQKRESLMVDFSIFGVANHRKNFFVPLFSKNPIRYNNWVSSFPFVSGAKWDDEKLVGIGFYSHTE